MLAGAAVSPMVAGIEPTFIQWAIENGKEVQYLESPSSFAALADGIPLSLVEHTLSRMLADAESVRHKQLAMHAAWIQCDMHAFERIAEALPLLEFPLIKSAILDLRSKAWARDLQKRVENTTKKTLVAVGALHLCISPTAQQSAQINLEPVNCV
jgi:uncharacterized protein YbaP (TraB family)